MEFELKLHNLKDTLGLLDTLNDNGYTYFYGEAYDVVRNDVLTMFDKEWGPKGTYVMYWVEINPELKTFGLHSKFVDIIYLRGEKLRQMNIW